MALTGSSPWTAGRPQDLVAVPVDEEAPGDPEDDERRGLTEDAQTMPTLTSAYGVDKATALDTRSKDILGMTLNKITFAKPPPVHDYPAPPTTPSQGDPTMYHPKAPTQMIVGARKSYLGRFMDSSVGRFSLFVVTLFMVNISILGLVSWNKPQYREVGMSFYYGNLSLFVLLLVFILPLIAERSGMSSLETGWKPFLVLYRLAFVVTVPAAALQVLGTGAEVEFGLSAGAAGELKLEDLVNTYWNYYELADGFVALNLTKGVTETRAPEEHGVEEHRRFSRFRDAELRVNTEPYSDQPEPTETPGRLATYRISPVFANWAPCTTRYRISAQCLVENPVLAWAVSKTTSLCATYKSVACRPPKPKLDPVYQCSDGGGVYGVGRKEPIEGLCGHVALPPPEGAIDEFNALLIYDAWPKISLPSSDSLWLDVTPDECIGNPSECQATWSTMATAGFACQLLANLFIVVSMILDCRIDCRIRQARKIIEEEEHKERYGNREPVPMKGTK
jgi:hypothetical protein